MPHTQWEFAIDVGGTFTDVVAKRPDGLQVTHKLLSSGVVRGTCASDTTRQCISAIDRAGETDDFWTGFELTVRDNAGRPVATRRVTRFEGSTGRLLLESPLSRKPPPNATYELSGVEEAPVLAIRYLMGLAPGQPIGHVAVRLGTTRATNALLERKGGRVAFVTTRGFGDILRIGNQDRPRLFELAIRKRDELFSHVIEIDERIDASGRVLRAPQAHRIHDQLVEAREQGVDALAVCLLHAHVKPDHERLIEREAAGIGFKNVSISSSVCCME